MKHYFLLSSLLLISSHGFAGQHSGGGSKMAMQSYILQNANGYDGPSTQITLSPSEMNDLFENYRDIESITLEDGNQVAPVARLEDLLGRRSLLTKDLEGRLIELKEQAD